MVAGDMLPNTEMRLLLESHGYAVDEVVDGIEVASLLELNPSAFDLVVIDFEMPADGIGIPLCPADAANCPEGSSTSQMA